MLNPDLRRLIWQVLLGLILLLVGMWALGLLPTEVNYCEHDPNTNNEDCAAYNVALLLLRQIGKFLDDHNGAISALATIAIAGFTLTLWLSSEKMWQATKQSANIAERALVDLERARVFIKDIKSDIVHFIAHRMVWQDGKHGPEFVPSVINLGRTPGNIELAVMLIQVLDKIPHEMTQLQITVADPNAEAIEIIIGPDKPYSFPSQRCQPYFTHDNAAAMMAGTAHLYCHGLITYFDIFMNRRTLKFCRRYDIRYNEWVPEGGKNRNSSD